MDNHNYSNIKEFYNSAKNAGVDTIIICYTDEWGPKQLEDNAVYCGPLQEATLLAYKAGVMMRCELSDDAADRRLLQQDIEDHGFSWSERERNNGKYGTQS
ncbi:MAG: hypothetical protein HRU15_08145 [Planctomycetes bacterium]|nr:hypothetical protein [Planctomycetota bacterium]